VRPRARYEALSGATKSNDYQSPHEFPARRGTFGQTHRGIHRLRLARINPNLDRIFPRTLGGGLKKRHQAISSGHIVSCVFDHGEFYFFKTRLLERLSLFFTTPELFADLACGTRKFL
jgi:hypothetical protein